MAEERRFVERRQPSFHLPFSDESVKPTRLQFLNITDGKNFSIPGSPMIVTNIVDFSDMKTGNDEIIREYYKRCEG